ncbi:MAG TPA: kelch repeat-containing protein, partial [Vicinamibacterales bacterium]|nr:kelch repeat-containing protein [Vicinamibacterales bacterium]
MRSVRSFTSAGLALAVIGLLFVGLHASVPTVPSNTWALTGEMSQPRAGAAATLLSDGLVLVTGGRNAAGAASLSAERYNPVGSEFQSTSPMTVARTDHTSTLLPDGRVLVAGGLGLDGGALTAAEIYNPETNAWTPAGPMHLARAHHTATALPDGRVAIAGGDDAGVPTASIEIFDPFYETFSMSNASLSAPRADHGAALLNDGRVFIAGGFDGSQPLASVDLYDPATDTTTVAAPLAAARAAHSVTRLLSGKVLVAGGAGADGELASAEVYDPAADIFAPAANSMFTARQRHQAILLPHNNQILIVGGTSAGSAAASAELFVEWQGDGGSFIPTTAPSTPRAWAAGAALSVPAGPTVRSGPTDGLALLAGGSASLTASSPFASAELYGFATVKTDRADYSPGQTVTISGSGWQPKETVTLRLVEDPLLDDHGSFTVVADDSGNILDTSFAPDEHDINIRFYLTASGARSQARTTFTDGNVASAPITLKNAPCISSQSAFALNATVCASVAVTTSGGGGAPDLFIEWFNPSSTLVKTTTKLGVANGSTQTDTLTLSGTNAVTGTWTVQTCKNTGCSGGNVLDSQTFTVTGSVSTTTTVTGSPVSPSTYGQAVSFTARVAPSSGTANPTGTVQFKIDGVDFGSPVGVATCAPSPNVCATSGSTATLAAGPHTIDASYVAAGSFTNSSGTLSFSVNPTPLTVKANDDTKIYGQTKTYGAGSTAFTPTGLQNGDTIGSVTITASGGAAAGAAVGSYTLTPSAATGGSFSSSNYTITYATGTLTVTPAPLDITASNDSKTYGEVKTYGAGSSAFSTGAGQLKNGETVGTVTITDTNSGGLATAAVGGSYPLTPSTATGGSFVATNYLVHYHAGALTV